jgi:hypothetical protein
MHARRRMLATILPSLPRLTLAAALGLTTTVAIAWYFGAFANWTDRHTITSYLAPEQSKLSSVRVWQVSRPGAVRRVVVTYGEAEWETGRNYIPEEAWFDLRIGPDTRFDVSWGRLRHAIESPRSVVQSVEDARGWPFLALRSWYNPSPPSAADLHGAIALDKDLTPESPAKLLPYIPLWHGLLADTGLFGGAWFLLLLVPAIARRRYRSRRGLCPRCGYDLRGGVARGCPECGWNRSPVQ